MICGLNPLNLHDSLDLSYRKVGQSNGFSFPFVYLLFHSLPDFFMVCIQIHSYLSIILWPDLIVVATMLETDGNMDEVQVNVVKLKAFQ